MSGIRVACQTYTWEMLGSDWQGKLTSILDWIAEAGYAGIEITNTMIGEFAGAPAAFRRELDRRGLALAAFGYASTGFADPATWDADVAGVEQAIEFVRHFPEPRLALGGATSPRPHKDDEAQAEQERDVAAFGDLQQIG